MTRETPGNKIHQGQIEKWARFVKENKDWKKHHTLFVDALIINAIKKYKKILELPNREDKLRRIRNLNKF